jgi:hypothetical protein
MAQFAHLFFLLVLIISACSAIFPITEIETKKIDGVKNLVLMFGSWCSLFHATLLVTVLDMAHSPRPSNFQDFDVFNVVLCFFHISNSSKYPSYVLSKY